MRIALILVVLLGLIPNPRLQAQIEIPVVVHIIGTNPDSVTDVMVQDGVKDLNEAFAHQGRYASLGPGFNTGIRFCLARRDPNGGNTSGITRTKSVLGDFDRDIEDLRMKGLVSWDTRRYCNIWLVKGIKTEIFPSFKCGEWTRYTEEGYATFPPNGEFSDGVVVTNFGGNLAHNLGHYLGLDHSFTIDDCSNFNCQTDGDGVCDTPPSTISSASCGTTGNTCVSDTVNGQGPDLPDLLGNFMTYSPCRSGFTKGQSDKMIGVLNSLRKSLLWPDRCLPACSVQDVLARFTRDNWFSVPGETVTFTDRGSNGSVFEWYVDGVPVSGTNSKMSYTFQDTGKYAVTLKVHNGIPGCFGSQTDSVIVSCGVMSRYFPDKRIIASKDPILLDSVIFTNRSVPSDASFTWRLGNGGSFPDSAVSNERDLRFTFPDSGTYVIRLVATKNGCSDTTLPYKLRVQDPTLSLKASLLVKCFEDTKLKLKIGICNDGYSSMPAGVPITFYDRDPTVSAARKFGQFVVPNDLKGKCCVEYDHILDVGERFLDELYSVINDNGTVPPPFKLLDPPPTMPNMSNQLPEILFSDNVWRSIGFSFRVSVAPVNATLVPDSTIRLQSTVSQPYLNATWLPSPGLSCTSCLIADYRAGYENEKLRFTAKSDEGCKDTAIADVQVPPWNDYKVTIDDVECSSSGNVQVAFTVCNDFVRGTIPSGFVVTFYKEDPTKPGSPAPLGTRFITGSSIPSKCASFTHLLPLSESARIYAVVNDIGTVPYAVPALRELQERDYGNNTAEFLYQKPNVTVVPSEATVRRGEQVRVEITSSVAKPSSIRWTHDPSLEISCASGCTSTTVTVKANGLLRLQMENRLSCKLDTLIRFMTLPPDFSVRIDSAQCHSSKETIVDFTVCTGNGYDSIPSGLPVSFFEGVPGSGVPILLAPAFQTATDKPFTCASYTHVLATPPSGKLFAVVNQRPTTVIPTSAIAETDLTNNLSLFSLLPFTVSIEPSDTTVPRMSRLALSSKISGGLAASYAWKSTAGLTCIDCPSPVADVPFTSTVSLEVKNRFNCLAQDTLLIKTYAEGRYQIPSAFTPNGDGLNDVFYLIGNRDLALVRDFSVYDRYGQRVFQRSNTRPNDPAYGWNGTRNGTPVPIGTYAYTFQVELVDGKAESVKGLVTVIR